MNTRFRTVVLFSIIITALFTFSSCGDKQTSTKYSVPAHNPRVWEKFAVVEEYYDSSVGFLYVVYDKDTKVMYYYIDSHYNHNLTPIYNSDGTIQVYSEK